ncbi:MAG: hypothetical protein JSS69_14280 [Acidobacteria bacterium]|nr:hypothetical protein [Acidobacteriota bacterium]MBS1867078.1 hypothetical protein [Acidobacteriota bacterium]
MLRTVRASNLNLFLALTCSFAFAALFVPSQARAWGESANKLVVNRAIETLPPDIRPFFENSRGFLLLHVNDPLAEKTPAERNKQFLLLEKYGHFPFEAIPRDYKAAVAKFGRPKLEANGLLPWQIGVYSQKLTESMRAGKWDEARLNAAILANYVAASHDPFNTTDNNDGRLSGQLGVNERFGATLIDRYSSFFPMRPNDAMFIGDPTDYAFEACLRSHSWLETILFADRNARRGLKSYNDEYYDRFYNQAAALLIRQLSDASTDVGSFWYTAWKNAGSPQLPH